MYLLYSRPINTIVIPKLNKFIAELFTPIYHEHKRSAPTSSNQYKRETILAIQSKISLRWQLSLPRPYYYRPKTFSLAPTQGDPIRHQELIQPQMSDKMLGTHWICH